MIVQCPGRGRSVPDPRVSERVNPLVFTVPTARRVCKIPLNMFIVYTCSSDGTQLNYLCNRDVEGGKEKRGRRPSGDLWSPKGGGVVERGRARAIVRRS